MPESESVLELEEEFPAAEGPLTPDEDETFGPEPDDPRAAGRFEDPYEVPGFDPAHERRDSCSERGL